MAASLAAPSMRTLTMRPVLLRARYAHVIRRDVRLSASSSQQEYCAALAFDLETTGLDLRTSEVVQIAIVIANSKRGACFVRKVLPEGQIDPGASAVHGFTREALIADGAAPFATVWKECEDWLDETLQSSTRPLVWAAHNGKRFDFPILTRCVNHVSGSTSALLRPPQLHLLPRRATRPPRPLPCPHRHWLHRVPTLRLLGHCHRHSHQLRHGLFQLVQPVRHGAVPKAPGHDVHAASA